MAGGDNTARKFYPRRKRSDQSGGPPKEISQVLTDALRKYGLNKDIARYQFVLHWDSIVGDVIAKRSRPECIRNGCLVVRVTDSAWAQELTFQKEVILKRLKRFVDEDEVVSDVMFCVGEV